MRDTAQHLVDTCQGPEVVHPSNSRGQSSLPCTGLLCKTFHSVIYMNIKTGPSDGIAWPRVPIETASVTALKRAVV